MCGVIGHCRAVSPLARESRVSGPDLSRAAVTAVTLRNVGERLDNDRLSQLNQLSLISNRHKITEPMNHVISNKRMALEKFLVL